MRQLPPTSDSTIVPPALRHCLARGGLSLVEVIIAMAVLTGAVLGLFSAFNVANDVNRMADSRDDVLDQVRRVVETIQVADTAAITANVTASTSTYDSDVYGLQPPTGRAKVIQVRKIAAPAGATVALTAMTISARWLNGAVTESYTTTYYHVAR